MIESTTEVSIRKKKLDLIIKCILTNFFDDDEESILFQMADKISPDPGWTDYIYWPSRYGLDGSIEATIEKAFAYQPIILGPPAD